MNLQLLCKIRCTEAEHDKLVCLIIDDTEALKSGLKSELDTSARCTLTLGTRPFLASRFNARRGASLTRSRESPSITDL